MGGLGEVRGDRHSEASSAGALERRGPADCAWPGRRAPVPCGRGAASPPPPLRGKLAACPESAEEEVRGFVHTRGGRQ